MSLYDPLIFGKSRLEKVVGLEVVDHEDGSNIELFIQKEDGTIETKIEPNKYWLLSDKQVQRDWVRLKGDLHYKWGKQYTSRQDFQKFRAIFKKNNDIYNIWNAQEAAMVKDGYTLFKNMKTSDVPVLAFDIETPGFEMDINSKVLIIANTFKDHKGNITRKMFTYDDYDSQADMLNAWCKYVQEINPVIICGHNIVSFDLPYIQTVAELHGVELNLGRNNTQIEFENRESKFRKEGSQFINYKKCKAFGRHIIDTFFLAIKYDVASRKYDSYGLKNIIAQEGLEVENRQHYDASKIAKNYMIPEEMVKIKAYAEEDADDSLALYDMMCPPFFYMTQMIPKPYQLIIESATGSQLNSMMVRSYLQDKHSIPRASEAVEFEGAISFGEPGVYQNAVSYDIASLYPSIMLQYNIHSPEKDPRGHMAQLLDVMRTERLKNKKLGKETARLLLDHEDYGANDLIEVGGGKTYTKKQLRALDLEIKETLIEAVPFKQEQFRKLAFIETQAAEVQTRLRAEVKELSDEESPIAKNFKELTESELFQKITKQFPEAKAVLPYLAGHALKSIHGKRTPAIATTPGKTPKAKPPGNPAGVGAAPAKQADKGSSDKLREQAVQSGSREDLERYLVSRL